jgi:hypothetical protein
MSETIRSHHPVQALMNLIITLLTPMFLAAAGNNLDFARQAAAETVNAYRAETHSDLITVAKIIGFGLAALAALSLSMAEDLPITTILRLHASANASDRSEHRNRGVLKQALPLPAPQPDIDEAALVAAAAEMKQRTAEHLAQFTAAPIADPTSPATNEERLDQATWAASAAAAIAAETAASLPNLSPQERYSAAIWIDALTESAKDFMTGSAPPRPGPSQLAAIPPTAGP